MDEVILLFFCDETSWTMPTRKILQGVFATEDAAVKEIPDWAKNSSYAKNNPGKYGADGQVYYVERHEVKK